MRDRAGHRLGTRTEDPQPEVAAGAGKMIPPTPGPKILSQDPHYLLHPSVAPRDASWSLLAPQALPAWRAPAWTRVHLLAAGSSIPVARGLGSGVALHPPAPRPTPGPCRAPAAPSPELIGRGNPVPRQRRKPDSPDI